MHERPLIRNVWAFQIHIQTREDTATELKEAANRILLHAKLLIACTMLGGLIALVTLMGSPTYVASTRLLVSGTTDRTGSGSTADTVLAIATTRAQLGRALLDVGVDRDLGALVDEVSVRSVGTSGVVELSVTDEDRVVAASLADTLARNVSQAMRVAHLASLPLPIVIDDASASDAETIPPIRLQDLTLGAVLGLIIGIGAAALLEALNPTVVGKEAIAAELGAPVLGVLPLTPNQDSGDLPWVRWQLGAQAGRAGVATVQLTTARPGVNLLPLAAALVTNGATPRPRPGSWSAEEQPSNLKIGILDRTDAVSIHPEESAGLVVVTPRKVKKTDIESAKDLVRITSWPLVGAIVYRRRGGARRSGKPGGGAEAVGQKVKKLGPAAEAKQGRE
jgi:protein tyrosine kinase modulator